MVQSLSCHIQNQKSNVRTGAKYIRRLGDLSTVKHTYSTIKINQNKISKTWRVLFFRFCIKTKNAVRIANPPVSASGERNALSQTIGGRIAPRASGDGTTQTDDDPVKTVLTWKESKSQFNRLSMHQGVSVLSLPFTFYQRQILNSFKYCNWPQTIVLKFKKLKLSWPVWFTLPVSHNQFALFPHKQAILAIDACLFS